MSDDKYRPSIDTKCPMIPEGATDWEAQEINRRWHNALSAMDRLRGVMSDHADRLLLRGRWDIPADVEYDHRMSGGGMTYYAAEAEAEMIALARVIDGAVHRIAMQDAG